MGGKNGVTVSSFKFRFRGSRSSNFKGLGLFGQIRKGLGLGLMVRVRVRAKG